MEKKLKMCLPYPVDRSQNKKGVGMKMKMYSVKLLIAVAFVGLLVLNGQAGEKPTLDDIVANVIQASTSPEAYQVKVTQTVSKETAVRSAEGEGIAPLATVPSVTIPFMLIYELGKGFSTKKVDLEERSAKIIQGVQNDIMKETQFGANVRITLNIQKLMKELQRMEKVIIGSGVLNGRQCYTISGKYSNGTGCVLWVDAEHWYVSKVIIDILRNRFSESTLEYRYYKNLWLASRIVINHASDGSRVTQEFGVYEFAQ